MSVFRHALIVAVVVAAMHGVTTAQTTALASGASMLSCSPAPCVLSAVQASQGPHQNLNAPLAASPINSNNLILGANDYNCGARGFESLGFYISSDAGSDWTEYCPPNFVFNGQVQMPIGEPILGYDHDGVAYIGGAYTSTEAFQKSSDGVNWSTPSVAVFRANTYSVGCWMAIDSNGGSPYVNSVYVSCVLGSAHPLKYQQVVVSHSPDGGATWRLAAVAPRQNIAEAQDATTAMAVGKDGTVYVTWQYCFGRSACQDDTTAYILISKSTDGGATWTQPKVVAPVVLEGIPNVGGVPGTAAIAVDKSSGPNAGDLYVSIYTWTGTFQQVQVVRSTNGGSTWEKPVPVAPGITHDQFLPWVSVSPAGLVGVSWLDRRNDPNNLNYQAFAAISTDGGLSFQPNVELTSTFSDPEDGGLGYDGTTWDGPNYFLAAWTDTTSAQDFVGGIRLK